MIRYLRPTTALSIFKAADRLSETPLPELAPDNGVYADLLAQGFVLPREFNWLLGEAGVPTDALDDIYHYQEIHPEPLYRRPAPSTTVNFGHHAFSLPQAASLLILFENLGFPTNPRPAVDQAALTLKAATVLTRPELDCLLYAEEKRGFSLTLPTDRNTGYEARILTGAGFDLRITEHALHVTGPLEIFGRGSNPEIQSLAIT